MIEGIDSVVPDRLSSEALITLPFRLHLSLKKLHIGNSRSRLPPSSTFLAIKSAQNKIITSTPETCPSPQSKAAERRSLSSLELDPLSRLRHKWWSP